jgi:hypothetical protein
VRLFAIAALTVIAATGIGAQRGQGAPAATVAPPTPKADAAIDITGTWVSVISEDWALRMVTPHKGDYTRIPITPAARKIADGWDPARDEAAGEQCKGYGAVGLTRLPGRLRIGWQDDRTMKLEFEAGNQTRLFHFGAVSTTEVSSTAVSSTAVPSSVEPSPQGQSVAEWQYTVNPPRSGELRVVTSRLRPGYLRKNGVPYSANTTMTEYYHRMTAPNADVWLTIVTEVKDPDNLRDPFVQSTHFKKLPANATFKPEPCEAR